MSCVGPEGRSSYLVDVGNSGGNQTIPIVLYGIGKHELILAVETKDQKQFTDRSMVISQLMEVGSNLRIREQDIRLTFTSPDPARPLEEDSDKQVVEVTVSNLADEPVEGVVVRLTAGPEYQDGQLLDEVLVGDIARESKKKIFYIWDLKGSIKEKYRLYAHAYIPEVADASPDDNYAFRDFNIYFAHNGQGAYSLFKNSYPFENRRMKPDEMHESIKRFIAYLATQSLTIPVEDVGAYEEFKKGFFSFLYPDLYERYHKYLNTLSKQGLGGLCHGLSASSLDFFEQPGKNPFSKSISTVNYEEAGPILPMYHLDQMTLFHEWGKEEGISFSKWHRKKGVQNTYNQLKNTLKNRRGNIISYNGWYFNNQNEKKYFGHAILGYKMVEVKGEDPLVYVYDPNYPFSDARNRKLMPVVTLDKNFNSWTIHFDNKQKYSRLDGKKDYFHQKYLWAYPLRFNLSQEDLKYYLDTYRTGISAFAEFLTAIDKYIIQLSCPADLLITDESGRRTGMVNGKFVDEIPDVEPRSLGETEFFYLPNGKSYDIQIIGHGNGRGDLSIIKPSGKNLDIALVEKIPLSANSISRASISSKGILGSVSDENTSIAPNLVSISAADSYWDETTDTGEVLGTNRPPEAEISYLPANPSKYDHLVVVSLSKDLDNDPMSYRWYIDDVLQEQFNDQTRFEWGPLVTDVLKIRLEVTDGNGHTDNTSTFVAIDHPEAAFPFDFQYLLYVAGLLLLVLLGWKATRKRKSQKKSNDGWVEVNLASDSFCSECGHLLPPNSKFCSNCGKKKK